MKEYNKKIIVLILIITFVFSPFFARKAEAQWIVFDPAMLVQTITEIVKEFGLDSLAWMIVNMIIERMTAATVNWINSGFQGQPAYLTDPKAYFLNMGDQIAGQFIFNDSRLKSLCGPINAKIQFTLARSYLNEQEWQCTPSLVGERFTDFMGDFKKGGWNAFFELSQKTQNNPIGAYIQAEGVLRESLTKEQEQTLNELNQGSGMLSFKTCERYGVAIEARDITVNGQTIHVPASKGPCMEEKTNTPGDVISEQLNKQLGLGGEKLAVADEINEMVSALLNQLIGKVFSSVSGGLRGTSQTAPTGGRSFLEELNQGTTTDVFGRPQDTSIADEAKAIDPYAGAPENPSQSWPDPELEENMKNYFTPTEPVVE